MAIRKARLLCMTLAILLASTACSSGAEKTNTQVPQIRSESAVEVADSASGVQMSDTTSSGFLGSQFNQEKAVAKGTAYIDVSSVANGYVAVSAVADKRLKFQVIRGNATYNYDMSNTGKPSIFPLQSGDGQYKFRIMKNVQDKKYAEIHSVVCDVKLSDPFQPFLRPSDYANYSQNSRCVAKAAEITKGMTNDLAKIKAVYEYVCKTVKYDRQKAATVKSGYLPTPDETMATGEKQAWIVNNSNPNPYEQLKFYDGEHFDFAKPWWYEDFMEDISIKTSMRFMLAGDYFIDLMRDFEILEVCRTGVVSLERGPSVMRDVASV